MKVKPFLKDPSAMSTAGTALGTAVSSFSKPTNSGAQGIGGMLSGAGQGAAMGTMIAPGIGTAIGAGAGAVTGLVTGALRSQKEQEAEKFARREARRAKQRLNSQRGKAVAAEFSNENIKSSSYTFAKGGYLKYANGGYLVEDGEVMYSAESPKTNSRGKASEIAPGTFKFDGDTHNSKSGGIGVKGGSSSFTDGTGNTFKSGFVLSNRLKTNPKPFLKYL